MRVLKSWLKDYVDIDIPDSELIDKLNVTGTEVDSATSSIDANIVIVEIKKVEKHPNADRLRLATVYDGEKEFTIVCGAPNIEVGQKVPLAKVGTRIGDFEIKEAEIRGVRSCGMLCSEKELGIGEDHSGIKILDSQIDAGTKLVDLLESDTSFELEITPNRGDCLSHIGIAREITAFTGNELKNGHFANKDSKKSRLGIEIENSEDCYQYLGAHIQGVEIKESPEWLKSRLTACGAKPINNIVDITNYIMLDLGQPLHAFDAKKVEDLSIIVRRSKDLEDIVTLDGQIRNLTTNNLVIADPKKAIAIAGIMGGANSEIGEGTTEIILEAAEFDPKVTRNSSKKLNLTTEASYRYERGIDPVGLEKAFQKAISLIIEMAGGELTCIRKEIAKPYQSKTINIPYDRINAMLNLDLGHEEIDRKIISLGFAVKGGEAIIPSWRHDISIWQDLVEEVGRLYGYQNIDLLEIPASEKKPGAYFNKKEYVKDFLAEKGFVEISSYTFLSEEDIRVAGLKTDNLLEVANPIQPENKFLRSSLIPGLLKTIAKNPAFDPILVFEAGNVFTKENESTKIALAASGKNSQKQLEDILQMLKEDLKLSKPLSIQELSREDLVRYKIRKPVTYVVEVDITELIDDADFAGKDISLRLTDKNIHYRPVSKYPALTRDLAFILNKSTDTDQVADTIYEVSALVNRVELFDEFASDKFGEGMKNIAYHLYLQHPERTLTDKEADEIIKSTVGEIETKYNAKLRAQ